MTDATTPESVPTPEPSADALPPTNGASSDPLEPAIRAVDHGDYAEGRRLASALVTHADDAVRRRALALVDQLGTDPVIVAVMSFTGLLMLTLYLLYQHAH